MPFGLSGAPASFQRLMNKLFCDVSFVDDILIHSKTQAEHVGHLAVVLSRLKDAGLTLRGHKCKIGLTKVHYLGHVFTTEGMAPDRGKVQAVKDWPVPSDASEVRQFLGLASYYRRKQLTQVPILAYPKFGSGAGQFVLATDASNTGIVLSEGVVYRRYAIGPCEDVIQVPLIPHAMREEALCSCHSAPGADTRGWRKTLARLRQEAFWPNMHNDVEFCKNCVLCQRSKLPNPTPASLTSMPIGQSWEMIAVDILEVPMSTNGNRYLMVVQDYFTKWAEAIPLKNQTAALINEALVKLCCIFGLPSIIHSDQGRAFESLLLRHTLDAFGIKKSRTTAYHPQGDGMVERFNRSLLQLLRTYTFLSPFVMMFGRQPKLPPSTNAVDAMTYSKSLCAKLDHLKDFVDTHLQQAAQHQKAAYDRHTKVRSFQVGQPVWLSVPTAGKLDPRWEGKWKITRIMSPVTVEISDGNRVRVVHVNRMQPRLQAGTRSRQKKDTGNPGALIT
eukprot:Em0001g3091a